MRLLLQIVSFLALVGTILPPAAYAAGALGPETMKLCMLGATAAWFAATPFWMGRMDSGAASSPAAPNSEAVILERHVTHSAFNGSQAVLIAYPAAASAVGAETGRHV